jgi:hypothetical protein
MGTARRGRPASETETVPGFAAIEDHLDFIKGQLARVPTRMELARIALGVLICKS